MSTDELRGHLGDPELKVVDVRPMSAYNGWRTNAMARGGHIPGALALPGDWLEALDDRELEVLLESKGISLGDEVVLYGDRRDDVLAVEERLVGLRRLVCRYADGWSTWAVDRALPVEQLTNYDKLVHPEWLRLLLDGQRPEASPASIVLLFHVNFGCPEEYADGHLPGAFHLDTNELEDPEDWNRRSPHELEVALRALGIRHDSSVVLYGRDSEGDANEKWPGRRAGQIAACRAALILRYCGVGDVRLLDGGYDAWARMGNPLETSARQPVPVASFGADIPLHRELIVDIDDAKQILSDREHAALVSVRTWREQIGEVSGYNYISPAGRIAGDVWGNCGTDAYHMQHYRNPDNTMRPYPEIAANWGKAGITSDKRVAFYCGTGWRASETWFYAYLIGWQRIAVYDGGWFEWSKDPTTNPIETGQPT